MSIPLISFIYIVVGVCVVSQGEQREQHIQDTDPRCGVRGLHLQHEKPAGRLRTWDYWKTASGNWQVKTLASDLVLPGRTLGPPYTYSSRAAVM